MKKVLTLLILMGAVDFSVNAQTRYQKYDSIYFENLFTPNFSSLLMPKGYVEAIISNALISFNRSWPVKSSDPKIVLPYRFTYDYNTIIINGGFSNNTRFNAGIEIHTAKGYQDSDRGSSPLNIFKGSPPGYVNKEGAVTTLGPRIKWRPFKHNLNFVYISTVQLPILNDTTKEKVLGRQRTQWNNTFLYSYSRSKHFAFFVEDDFNSYFKRGEYSSTIFVNTFSVYGYWLVSKHFFPFLSAGHTAYLPAKTEISGVPIAAKNHAFPIGAGLQYQYSLRFTFTAYYSQYAQAANTPDYKTINLGVRGVF